jgi:uncharacterized C2H2 Zn-finger protein
MEQSKTTHTCPKCNKTFNYNYELIRHINKKKSCIVDENAIIVEKRGAFNCDSCEKTFTRKSSLVAHQKKTCKQHALVLTENENLKKELTELKQKLTVTNTINNNNNNGTINTNINNEIINNKTINNYVLDFGKENLDFITDEMYKKIISKVYCSIQSMIEIVHFNPKHPENYNIRKKCLNDKYIQILKDNEWKTKDLECEIKDLIDKYGFHLELKYDEYKDQLNDNTKKKFENFIEKRDCGETLKTLMHDVTIILYDNNGKVVQKYKSVKN